MTCPPEPHALNARTGLGLRGSETWSRENWDSWHISHLHNVYSDFENKEKPE
jgi:hypothetical protein